MGEARGRLMMALSSRSPPVLPVLLAVDAADDVDDADDDDDEDVDDEDEDRDEVDDSPQTDLRSSCSAALLDGGEMGNMTRDNSDMDRSSGDSAVMCTS